MSAPPSQQPTAEPSAPSTPAVKPRRIAKARKSSKVTGQDAGSSTGPRQDLGLQFADWIEKPRKKPGNASVRAMDDDLCEYPKPDEEGQFLPIPEEIQKAVNKAIGKEEEPEVDEAYDEFEKELLLAIQEVDSPQAKPSPNTPSFGKGEVTNIFALSPAEKCQQDEAVVNHERAKWEKIVHDKDTTIIDLMAKVSIHQRKIDNLNAKLEKIAEEKEEAKEVAIKTVTKKVKAELRQENNYWLEAHRTKMTVECETRLVHMEGEMKRKLEEEAAKRLADIEAERKEMNEVESKTYQALFRAQLEEESQAKVEATVKEHLARLESQQEQIFQQKLASAVEERVAARKLELQQTMDRTVEERLAEAKRQSKEQLDQAVEERLAATRLEYQQELESTVEERVAAMRLEFQQKLDTTLEENKVILKTEQEAQVAEHKAGLDKSFHEKVTKEKALLAKELKVSQSSDSAAVQKQLEEKMVALSARHGSSMAQAMIKMNEEKATAVEELRKTMTTEKDTALQEASAKFEEARLQMEAAHQAQTGQLQGLLREVTDKASLQESQLSEARESNRALEASSAQFRSLALELGKVQEESTSTLARLARDLELEKESHQQDLELAESRAGVLRTTQAQVDDEKLKVTDLEARLEESAKTLAVCKAENRAMAKYIDDTSVNWTKCIATANKQVDVSQAELEAMKAHCQAEDPEDVKNRNEAIGLEQNVLQAMPRTIAYLEGREKKARGLLFLNQQLVGRVRALEETAKANGGAQLEGPQSSPQSVDAGSQARPETKDAGTQAKKTRTRDVALQVNKLPLTYKSAGTQQVTSWVPAPKVTSLVSADVGTQSDASLPVAMAEEERLPTTDAGTQSAMDPQLAPEDEHHPADDADAQSDVSLPEAPVEEDPAQAEVVRVPGVVHDQATQTEDADKIEAEPEQSTVVDQVEIVVCPPVATDRLPQAAARATWAQTLALCMRYIFILFWIVGLCQTISMLCFDADFVGSLASVLKDYIYPLSNESSFVLLSPRAMAHGGGLRYGKTLPWKYHVLDWLRRALGVKLRGPVRLG